MAWPTLHRLTWEMQDERPTAADALCAAAGGGNVGLVRRCLAEGGTSASALGGIGSYPVLKHAAVNGHLHVMEVLLRHGADIDGHGPDGRTALHFAAVTFQLEALEFLLGRGARVSVAAKCGATPLQGALGMFLPGCMMNERKLAVVQRLLEAGAAVYGHSEHHLSALAEMVRAPDFSVPRPLQLRAFDLLVAHGAAVDERDRDMRTVLHYASRANNFEIVLRLLKLGADVTAVDLSGETAADAAGRQSGRRCEDDDARVGALLRGVHRRVRDRPKMHAFCMGLRALDTERCSVPLLSTELVREIFGVRKPETAFEREVEALAEVQLRLLHA